MTLAVEHFGLPARNPAALKDWYVSALGGEVIFDNGKVPPAFFVRIGRGFLLEIYEGDFGLKETSDNALHGWRHLALRVDSLESAQAELAARGVAFPDPVKPAGGGGKVVFFKDPEGNLLHLVERPAGSVFDPHSS